MANSILDDISDDSDLTDLADFISNYTSTSSDDDDDDDRDSVFTLPDIQHTTPMTPYSPDVQTRKRKQSSPSTDRGSPKRRKPLLAPIRMARSKRASIVRNVPASPIESTPNEITQLIVGKVDNDEDLCNLGLSSPVFLDTVFANTSGIWRTRFLSKYDYPKIDGPFDFEVAYKLRRLVLKNFVDFTEGMSRRTEIQLEVLRDMLIETYNNPNPWCPPPTLSRNLRWFESPSSSPWVLTFLSCSFPGITDKQRWGQAHAFFEILQLTLSHLLLSPQSALSHLAASSRENYDLVNVYNFDQPFSTLYTRCDVEAPQSPSIRNSLFPNLKPSGPDQATNQYELDTNTLLHIRNFWHRHLIDDSHPIGENTYALMARWLQRMGKSPRKWSQALDSDIVIPTRWFGMYSCLSPWPKARKDLEERQNSAEDWEHVDPMMLDLTTSSDYRDGFWPPAFSTIPALDKTITLPEFEDDAEPWYTDFSRRSRRPNSKTKKHYFPKPGRAPIYIRGIAPFINSRTSSFEKENEASPSSSTSTSNLNQAEAQTQAREKFLKHHPFTALRVRGLVHSISASATLDSVADSTTKAIPGWTRIVMVMYKPNITYLINVLEHAAEDYGGAFGTQITNQLNTANIWGGINAAGTGSASNPPSTSNSTSASATSAAQADPQSSSAAIATTTDPNTTSTTTLSTSALITHLQTRLYDLLTSPTNPFPTFTDSSTSTSTSMSSATPTSPSLASLISSLEDAYIPPHHLAWDESIDYAYVYEGAVLPGGNIMMGRWWRCHGITGVGEGWEVGGDGEGEDEAAGGSEESGGDIGGGEGDGEGSGSESGRARRRDLERGPFVFWC